MVQYNSRLGISHLLKPSGKKHAPITPTLLQSRDPAMLAAHAYLVVSSLRYVLGKPTTRAQDIKTRQTPHECMSTVLATGTYSIQVLLILVQHEEPHGALYNDLNTSILEINEFIFIRIRFQCHYFLVLDYRLSNGTVVVVVVVDVDCRKNNESLGWGEEDTANRVLWASPGILADVLHIVLTGTFCKTPNNFGGLVAKNALCTASTDPKLTGTFFFPARTVTRHSTQAQLQNRLSAGT